MKQKYLLITFFLFILGCTEKEIIPEPDPIPALPPGEFVVTINNITDIGADISWTTAVDPDSGTISYDIAVGDSIIAYDLKDWYRIQCLMPDSAYTVSVIAMDEQRNQTVETAEFHTMKSFIQKIIDFDLEYEVFGFMNGIGTRDGGLLIYGADKGSNAQRYSNYFFLKLDSNYKIEWMREKYYGQELNAMIESSGNDFYVLFPDYLLKFDNQGNEEWEFAYPPEYNIYLYNLAEAGDGNLIIVGNSISGITNDVLSRKYFVSKLSPDKNEIWSRLGTFQRTRNAKAVIIEGNGNITISGTTETVNSLMFLDNEGQFIKEYIYPSIYTGSEDVGKQFLNHYEEDYLLFGTTSKYGQDVTPRFLRIDKTGKIVWDKYHYLSCSNYFPILVDVDEMANSEFLLLTRSYGGMTLASIKMDGEIGFEYKLVGFPGSIAIHYDNDGNYVYFTIPGQLLILNHDGYFPE